MRTKPIRMFRHKVRVETVCINRPKYKKRSNGHIYKLNKFGQWERVIKK